MTAETFAAISFGITILAGIVALGLARIFQNTRWNVLSHFGCVIILIGIAAGLAFTVDAGSPHWLGLGVVFSLITIGATVEGRSYAS